MASQQPMIAYHTLYIANPKASLDFYQDTLGMTLIEQYQNSSKGEVESHYLLGFVAMSLS